MHSSLPSTDILICLNIWMGDCQCDIFNIQKSIIYALPHTQCSSVDWLSFAFICLGVLGITLLPFEWLTVALQLHYSMRSYLHMHFSFAIDAIVVDGIVPIWLSLLISPLYLATYITPKTLSSIFTIPFIFLIIARKDFF